ncbi:PREDICTED: 28S ribosomal protein S26, mitochondrial-like [Branchiostoma belcheri]|uniref:Small ribosomal subunit protein mS26 n=1 Tax=Branchiostoma belcheri TaxID=7741 RepID=A0A6P4Z9V6_BRABE|nr:PREDICTED: 28S ribosomal protein S26, mitochondrial-like [Branchiostoma belcheri]
MFPRLQGVLCRHGPAQTPGMPASAPVVLQFVRFRKPRHVPRAPSKANYVRKLTPIDPEEHTYLKTAYNNYKTHFRAVRNMFLEEYLARKRQEEGADTAKREKEEDEEHFRLMEWNRRENERMHQERLVREQRVALEREKADLETSIWKEQREQEIVEKMDELIRLEKEASQHFITLDNVEEAIESALSDPKNYNFAVDRDGNIVQKTPFAG